MGGRTTLELILLCFLVSAVSAKTVTLELGDKLDLNDFPDSKVAKDVFKISVDPSELAEADHLILPSGETLELEGEATFKADGCADLDFKGAEDSDASAELTVCLDEDTGTGTVNGNFENDDGQEYDLQTRVNGEGHVVFVLDMKKLEDMQNSGDAVGNSSSSARDLYNLLLDRGFSRAYLDAALAKGRTSNDMVRLSAWMYFTYEYQLKTKDVNAMMDHIIGSVNEAFRRNDIKIEVFKHCVERYFGPEEEDIFNSFANYKGGRKEVHSTADLVHLINVEYHYCGLGSYMSTSYPIAVSEKWCAEADYTAQHEWGHNLGATHDPAASSNEGYNHGYLMPETKKRTVMAYNSDSAHGTLINYFSDDERKDNEGAKLGTATADNTRMLQERRFLYKDIGDESQACPQNFGYRCTGQSDCCTTSNKCRAGEGVCTADDQCGEGLQCGDAGSCNGLFSFKSTDRCCQFKRDVCKGDRHCCTFAFPCDQPGQGDCDSDDHCKGDELVCGEKNCQGDTFDKDDDCCMRKEDIKCDKTTENTGWSCCKPGRHLCTDNEGDCDSNSDCVEGLVCGTDNCKGDAFYEGTDCCAPRPPCDKTTETEGWSCCTSKYLCDKNQGDCDSDGDCKEGLFCGTDNCEGDAFYEGTDCCTDRQICTGGDSCCRPVNRCGAGEGDCDSDKDCQDGFKCGTDNCSGDTFDAGDDCCYKPT